MASHIVVTLDERDDTGEVCSCGKQADCLIVTVVYRDGVPLPGAGSVQSGCYGYGDLIHQTALRGAVRGGCTVELEDYYGIPSERDPRDDDAPFDGPPKPEHEE